MTLGRSRKGAESGRSEENDLFPNASGAAWGCEDAVLHVGTGTGEKMIHNPGRSIF